MNNDDNMKNNNHILRKTLKKACINVLKTKDQLDLRIEFLEKTNDDLKNLLSNFFDLNDNDIVYDNNGNFSIIHQENVGINSGNHQRDIITEKKEIIEKGEELEHQQQQELEVKEDDKISTLESNLDRILKVAQSARGAEEIEEGKKIFKNGNGKVYMTNNNNNDKIKMKTKAKPAIPVQQRKHNIINTTRNKKTHFTSSINKDVDDEEETLEKKKKTNTIIPPEMVFLPNQYKQKMKSFFKIAKEFIERQKIDGKRKNKNSVNNSNTNKDNNVNLNNNVNHRQIFMEKVNPVSIFDKNIVNKEKKSVNGKSNKKLSISSYYLQVQSWIMSRIVKKYNKEKEADQVSNNNNNNNNNNNDLFSMKKKLEEINYCYDHIIQYTEKNLNPLDCNDDINIAIALVERIGEQDLLKFCQDYCFSSTTTIGAEGEEGAGNGTDNIQESNSLKFQEYLCTLMKLCYSISMISYISEWLRKEMITIMVEIDTATANATVENQRQEDIECFNGLTISYDTQQFLEEDLKLMTSSPKENYDGEDNNSNHNNNAMKKKISEMAFEDIDDYEVKTFIDLEQSIINDFIPIIIEKIQNFDKNQSSKNKVESFLLQSDRNKTNTLMIFRTLHSILVNQSQNISCSILHYSSDNQKI